MRRQILALALVCTPIAANAQQFSGPAIAVDGDTLAMTDQRVRLHGIDAPEGAQTCKRSSGEQWACGRDATALLAQIVGGKTVQCIPRDRDAYGRTVASCRVGERDLGGVMVREGYAIALENASADYLQIQERAKKFGMAIWGSQFQTPADYRAANPRQFAPPLVRAAAPVRRSSAFSQSTAVWFRNCNDARAAGAVPLYRGQAGYRPQMDGDGDGIACEPYRGRR
jgi:endonuclease YncB( thermonuclease family)